MSIELESLKGQSVGELVKLARKLEGELFTARFQHATQQLKTPHKVRELRRDIEREKTITTQKRHADGKGIVAKVKTAPVKAAAAPKAPKAEKATKVAEKAAAKPKAKKEKGA